MKEYQAGIYSHRLHREHRWVDEKQNVIPEVDGLVKKDKFCKLLNFRVHKRDAQKLETDKDFSTLES